MQTKKTFPVVLIWLFLFLSYPTLNLQGQNDNTYQLSWRLSGTMGGAGLAGSGLAEYLKSRKDTLTHTQIELHNAEDIWRPDRISTRYWSPTSIKLSDIGMTTGFAMPLSMLFDSSIRSEGWEITGMYLQTFLLTYTLTALTKEITKRSRPFVYNPHAPLHEKTKKDARSSFFSGHTSITAASTFFFATVYSDFYPERNWQWATVWSLSAAVPLATGIFRVTAGKHFPTDILVGYAVGAAVGILVPRLHRIN